MSPLPELDHAWAVRIRPVGTNDARVYARTSAFDVGDQASLRESDPHPSALEYVLGALGADLLQGFRIQAARRSLVIHDLEVALSGRLNNVLVHLGVIGEHGHAGLESVTGTLYASADADEDLLQSVWQEVLTRSPVFNTLSRAAVVSVELRMSS